LTHRFANCRREVLSWLDHRQELVRSAMRDSPSSAVRMESTTNDTAESVTPNAAEREIVVFRVRRDTECSECRGYLGRGGLLRREDDWALCLECADLDALEFLPRGDSALMRRARKYSTLQAVVVEWSRSRQRYQRQGVLVETDALLKAEIECLSDADVRARQRMRAALKRDDLDQSFVATFAAAIQSAYPNCRAAEAEQIANRVCERHSVHVGRTAGARELDPEAVRLAVVAHVRHTHTKYDRLLTQLMDRREARDEVREDVSAVLRQWSEPTNARQTSSSEPSAIQSS
jgi:hypothetical protein